MKLHLKLANILKAKVANKTSKILSPSTGSWERKFTTCKRCAGLQQPTEPFISPPTTRPPLQTPSSSCPTRCQACSDPPTSSATTQMLIRIAQAPTRKSRKTQRLTRQMLTRTQTSLKGIQTSLRTTLPKNVKRGLEMRRCWNCRRLRVVV